MRDPIATAPDTLSQHSPPPTHTSIALWSQVWLSECGNLPDQEPDRVESWGRDLVLWEGVGQVAMFVGSYGVHQLPLTLGPWPEDVHLYLCMGGTFKTERAVLTMAHHFSTERCHVQRSILELCLQGGWRATYY